MPILVYFAAPDAEWPEWEGPLRQAFAAAGLDAVLTREADPGAVDYLVYAPPGTVSDFSPFVRAKAVLSLWAGVERIVGNGTLTQPLCRMVDPAMTSDMVCYVVGHVLRHHLGTDNHLLRKDPVWDQVSPPNPAERPVAMLGLGELGGACAAAIASLGFPVTGWSRSAKALPFATDHGEEGLRRVLAAAEIVVTLLPRTAETDSLLDARRLGWMRRSAVLVNPGRGALIDEEALLAALDSGHIGHATLDVFRKEPLPADHRFWTHPRVTVTPHIAANTHPSTASRVIAENIRRGEAGEPFLHRVDRALSY